MKAWKFKSFKTEEALLEWININKKKYQIETNIFVNNHPFCLEYCNRLIKT